ncbi:MAG: hypothetical protein RLZZ546_1586 [Bacteroidota bacterium]|jgi:outer membrane protein OmpA-like peptidoglycan-associated protein
MEEKYIYLSIFLKIGVLSLLINTLTAQKCLYNSDTKNWYIYKYFDKYEILKTRNGVGGYAPYRVMNGNVREEGVCKYIFSKLDSIKSGERIKIEFKVYVGEAFFSDSFYSSHFGFILSNSLPKENISIWKTNFHRLDIKTRDTAYFNFELRPQCIPKYIVFGVFRKDSFPQELCDFCWYKFEIANLKITEVEIKLPEKDKIFYVCDSYFESSNLSSKTVDNIKKNIYFERGSSEISIKDKKLLDSISGVMQENKNRILRINSFTDKTGENNIELGRLRCEIVFNYLNKNNDRERFILNNYHSLYSKNGKNPMDRRVDIEFADFKISNLYYSKYLKYLVLNDFKNATDNFEKWLKHCQLDDIIYAYFDCHLSECKNKSFEIYIKERIKKFKYKNSTIRFSLDSIWCEDQRFRALNEYILMLGIGDEDSFKINKCFIEAIDSNDFKSIDDNNFYFSEKFLSNNKSLCELKKYGRRGLEAILYPIIHSSSLLNKQKYLDFIKNECQKGCVPWEYYAILYDKICIAKGLPQRYGTQFRLKVDKDLELLPIENLSMLNEWRKQVKLAPIID